MSVGLVSQLLLYLLAAKLPREGSGTRISARQIPTQYNIFVVFDFDGGILDHATFIPPY